jgi:hypothetical protein
MLMHPIILSIGQNLANHAHELILAFIGTFFGAFLAFALEQRDRTRERLSLRNADGNIALITLWQMWEILNQYKKEVIDTAPDDAGRWLNMSVTQPESHGNLGFDLAKLHFLLDGKDKNLLGKLLLEQRRFYSAIALINRRSELMLKEIWPRFPAAGIERGKQYDERAIKQVLGENNLIEARTLADGLTANITENLASFKVTFQQLRAQLHETMPKKKFINVDFQDLAGSVDSRHAS